MVIKANIIITYPNIYRSARLTLNKLVLRHISRTLEPPATEHAYDSPFIKMIKGIMKLSNICVFRDKIYTHCISKSKVIPSRITHDI